MATEPAAPIEATIKDLRAFLPAKDFAMSKSFYAAVGFDQAWSSDDLVLFRVGGFSFFLQNYFVQQWADNMMVDLRVTDVDAYWSHLKELDLTGKWPAPVRLGAPQDDAASGIRRGHFVDPSGVLWHFSQTLK